MRWPWRTQQTLSLPEIWKAIDRFAVDGDQPIVPAKVGAVTPLKGRKEHEFLRLLKRQA